MVNLKIEKIADKDYLLLSSSDTINYSIIITNLGDEIASYVKVRDLLSKGALLIPESISVNGCPYNSCGCDESIIINSIIPGANVFITYQVTINKNYPPNNIINIAEISYFNTRNEINYMQSNELVIPVIDINICMTKSADKYRAKVGDTIIYTVFVRNNSTINLENTIFFDKLPADVMLINNSVKVNSVIQNIDDLCQGLNLGTINSKSSVLINFEVKIVNVSIFSSICNTGYINFEYSVKNNAAIETITGTTCSNCAKTNLIG